MNALCAAALRERADIGTHAGAVLHIGDSNDAGAGVYARPDGIHRHAAVLRLGHAHIDAPVAQV